MNNVMMDLKYAFRQLRRSPGFTVTAVLILALGIGANAAIFTLVNAVLLRNLPVADPKMLVRLGDRQDCCVNGGMPGDDSYSIFAYDLYRHLQDNSPDFEQMAAMQSYPWNMTVRSDRPGAVAAGVPVELVSGNYFQTFGLSPYVGRLLTPADDQANAAPAAVMSYQTWQRVYGGDPKVVGSTFTFNAHPVTVVGIAPASFYGERMIASPANFFMPFSMEPITSQSSLLHVKQSNWVYIIGRMKPGAMQAVVQQKLSGSLRQWLHENLDSYRRQGVERHVAATHVTLTPGGAGIAQMQEQYGSGLHLLVAISALVLLIACANLANLVLVRSMGRAAETSLRMALGAQRARILRQMLTESVTLSVLGGSVGIAVAYAGAKMLLALAFPHSPNLPIQASPSPLILGFAFGLSLLTGLLFGLAPAWLTSKAQPAEALRGAHRTTGGGASLLQKSLVVLQAALSLVLLIGAGLLAKSLSRLEHQDYGFQTADRVVIHMDPENAGYKPEQLAALYDEITAKFRAIPGVETVGLASYSPLEGDSWGEGVMIQGKPEPGPDDDMGSRWLRVSPGLLDLVGETLVKGRGITEHDTATSPGVALVNEAFVKKFFKPGEESLGAHFGTNGMKSTGDFEIVGVVKDAKWQQPREEAQPRYFRALTQLAASNPLGEERSLHTSTIMLKTRGPIAGLESLARKTLTGINPNLPVTYYSTFDDQVSGNYTQERLIARLTLLFSGLALVLASVGLYGVTSYTVARRTSEIGIRMALGAARGNVVMMVLREAVLQAAIGLALGVPIALACVRLMKTQLYDVAGHDTAVMAFAVFALILSAVIAGLIPARRAASTDPMRALRAE
jgi:macrolide transport system ATP-binding/permease protein